MNERLYISTGPAVIELIEELSRVMLRNDVEADDGKLMLAGSSGTVISVYGDGEAYCIEFTSPFQAEIIVKNQDLEAIAGEHRGHDITSSTRMKEEYFNGADR